MCFSPAMEGLYGDKSDHKTNSINELEVSVKEANKHTALHQGNMNISKANVMLGEKQWRS